MTLEEWKVFCREQRAKGLKLCRSCNEWKDKYEYFGYKRGARDRRRYECYKCENEIAHDQHIAGAKRKYNIKHKYGITQQEWEEIFNRQGRVCAICKSSEPKRISGWCTDHCYTTNRVRGILCHPCNLALGVYENTILPNINIINSYRERKSTNVK